jgi:CubicO group peptidase (beta-lactamase class C family)
MMWLFRHLLTHTSGISYEFTNPMIGAWRQWAISNTPEGRENSMSKDIGVAFRIPLIFDPGENWAYGYGIDWVGQAVMRATNKTLEEYMAENIWKPLGMSSTTFDPWVLRSDLSGRVAGMTERNEEKKLVNGDSGYFVKGIGAQNYSGGGGGWSTANDYVKFISSLLKTMKSTTQEHNLLKASTLAEMIDQTLSPTASKMLNAIVSSPMAAGLAGNIPPGVKVTYGLGGVVNQSPIDKATARATKSSIAANGTGRAANAIQWCGLANCHWWISPGDDVCGLLFGQVLPAGDNATLRLYEEFEGILLQELRDQPKSA